MFTLGIARQFVLTSNIRDWDVIEQNRFPFGNKGIRDLAPPACCERLLPNYVDLNYSTSSRTKVVVKVGKGCLYS